MIFATNKRAKKMAATREVNRDGERHIESLKNFSGIPSHLIDDMSEKIEKRKASSETRVRVSDIYGEAITGYIDAVEAGREKPDIKAQSTGPDARNCGVWLDLAIAERFEKFVDNLGQGNESAVFIAALRWCLSQRD